MANQGSPLAMLDVVNSVENILTIRDGQIRCYAKDAESGEWTPQPVVPAMSAPATEFSTFAAEIPGSAPVALESHACLRMMVLNHPDNTGRIWIGGQNVTVATGIPIEPGQSQELSLSDTGSVYAIAEVDTETLIVAYLR
jgi:hypothetical protein